MENKYQWKQNVTINTAYAAMFPIQSKTATIGQLYHQKKQNLYKGYKPIRANSLGAVFYGKNIKLSCKILSAKMIFDYKYNGNVKTYFKSNGNTNKLYVALKSEPAKYTVQNGTVWNIKTEYKMM